MANDTQMITDNFIYFYHLDKFCIIPTYPESISDQMSTTFASTNALGRSAPVFSFINAGPRTVAVSLNLHRDLMNDVNKNISNLKSNVVDVSGDDYIDTLIKYLQAASLPKYNAYSSSSKVIEPPMVAIKFGNEIFIKGVINSQVQVTYGKPIMVGGKYAKVDITFTVSESDPYDALDVVNEGSFRGITSTFKNGVYRTNVKGSSNNKSKYGTTNTTQVMNEINRTKTMQKKIAK